MKECMFFGEGRQAVENFLLREYPSLSGELTNQLINFFPLLNDYKEESVVLRPTLIFCSSIDKLCHTVSNAYPVQMFEDTNASTFRMRMKALAAFSRHGWYVYIEYKENSIKYGIIKCLNSVKEQSLERMLLDSAVATADKKEIIFIRSVRGTAISLRSVSGNELSVDFSLSKSTEIADQTTSFQTFIADVFSKLRTTKQKMMDIKNLLVNIFETAFRSISGAICVVVDRDYVDNGFLDDGVWLKKPIELSKLFLQSKSYSEAKLIEISNLFIDMLNYDGITVIDNLGRILAYNVFVESSSSRAANIVGGARKRAAYTIINTKRKKIIGALFQSQDGEMFYARVKATLTAEKIDT